MKKNSLHAQNEKRGVNKSKQGYQHGKPNNLAALFTQEEKKALKGHGVEDVPSRVEDGACFDPSDLDGCSQGVIV